MSAPPSARTASAPLTPARKARERDVPPQLVHDPHETRLRLLDAAEALFAEHGYKGVSLRTITGKAGVNLAAAHYHFRNKEGLYRAVFERRVGPMNTERDTLLAACVAAEAQTGALDVAAVLDAFIGPSLRVGALPGGETFRRLSGRAAADPSPEVRRVVYELYDPVAMRFVEVLTRACPHLTREDLFWRLACAYGAMMYVRADSGRLQRLLGDDLSMADSAAAMHHLIPMLTAGFALPSLSAPPAEKKKKAK
ncbi:TetR/AcrR family transcriptional regulator [Aquabacter spiritensis]|uniref:TetR family transcriptional regulator n=1 Tax=Aquabacter spiritensis TaxID=933073 RepID=A0A4R3LZQ1_9HYPH|nr:TetR/AcrR family transcriptional regulator [Aquabacter spiritensis]TCT06172.1 TetR family transcriptional regulator [Aquabacter spiritensis]